MALTQAEKFKAIADAIRGVEDRTNTFTIKANDFANEIKLLDPKLNAYSEKFDNGYYALRAVACAASYLTARTFGEDQFVYSNDTLFYDKDSKDGKTFPVRREEYGRIDCSTFIGLCLRGIPYGNSPYDRYKDNDATWVPSKDLLEMYGTEGWEFRELDYQPKNNVFNDIGIPNYTTIRYAADYARYFYKYGYVLYDQKTDGIITDISKINDLQPGDLVFWDTSENKNPDSRFKSISHIALVAENTNYYYQVTGKVDVIGQDVIHYTAFAEENTIHPNSKLVLAIRPDYRPRYPKEEVPIDVNLLNYPWSYSRKLEYTKNDIVVTAIDKEKINIKGTPSASTLIYLKGNANNTIDHITLTPGTYELTGIEGFTGVAFALQVLDKFGNELNNEIPIRYPIGQNATNQFTLLEETDIIVRLYISSNLENIDANINPTLKRIS